MPTPTHEIRAGQPIEIRAADDGTCRVSGYAAVFGEEAEIGSWFRERVDPGAFTNAIGRDDVVFLVNHDGLPLARTKSGTLTLREDDRGLYVESDLDEEDPDVAQIVPKMRRGDLDKMSFAFRAVREEWDETGDIPLRTIMEVELFDVSIVNQPAYEGTEIALRSLEASRGAEQRSPATVKATLAHKLALAERT